MPMPSAGRPLAVRAAVRLRLDCRSTCATASRSTNQPLPFRCLASAVISKYTVVGVPTGGVTTAKPLLKFAAVGMLISGGLVSDLTAGIVGAAAVLAIATFVAHMTAHVLPLC